MNVVALLAEHAATLILLLAIVVFVAVIVLCALGHRRSIKRRQQQLDVQLQASIDAHNAHLERRRAAHYDEARVAEHLRRIADMDPEP